MRAVVIEPDAELSRRIVEALNARGWTVLTAHGYRDGLALVRRARAVAALCVAERLSQLTGPDLLATLGRDPGLARIPAVLRVAHDASLVARALARVGASVVSVRDAEVIADAVVRVSKPPTAVENVRVRALELCRRSRRNVARAAELIRHARALVARSLALRGLLRRRSRRGAGGGAPPAPLGTTP
jgi:CheY-like chemotaxis protein